ncbi:MAG: four helix bundle protein [Parcubacteria group bacterium]
MTNQAQNPKSKKVYDLIERTSVFGEGVVDFVKTLPRDEINKTLISQLVRSGTSVGANYMEADCAESKKDFIHKMTICKKEAKETLHWIRIIAHANQNRKDECRDLYRESHELLLIFSAIIGKKK